MDKAVLDLLRDVQVRKALSEVVKPLEREGLDRFEVRTAVRNPAEVITKEDASSFVAPIVEDEPIISDERTAAFSIVALTFKDGNKWRLYDGQNTISVTIEDEAFIRRVNRQRLPLEGDLLVCRPMSISGHGNSLRTEYAVLEVMEHRVAARQLALPFSVGDAGCERRPTVISSGGGAASFHQATPPQGGFCCYPNNSLCEPSRTSLRVSGSG